MFGGLICSGGYREKAITLPKQLKDTNARPLYSVVYTLDVKKKKKLPPAKFYCCWSVRCDSLSSMSRGTVFKKKTKKSYIYIVIFLLLLLMFGAEGPVLIFTFLLLEYYKGFSFILSFFLLILLIYSRFTSHAVHKAHESI